MLSLKCSMTSYTHHVESLIVSTSSNPDLPYLLREFLRFQQGLLYLSCKFVLNQTIGSLTIARSNVHRLSKLWIIEPEYPGLRFSICKFPKFIYSYREYNFSFFFALSIFCHIFLSHFHIRKKFNVLVKKKGKPKLSPTFSPFLRHHSRFSSF